jgi:hypothetical protein
VYDNTAEDIRRSLPVEGAYNEDNLALPKDASDLVFTKLEQIVEDVISPATCADSLVNAVGDGLPKPYRNISLILYAAGARRRGRRDLAEQALEECTKPLFTFSFTRLGLTDGSVASLFQAYACS